MDSEKLSFILSPGKGLATYVNLHNLSAQHVYANDALDTGNASNYRGLFASTSPVTSNSGSFVPIATPIMSKPSVSSGGTDAVGTNSYCVWAVGFNGGWSAASCGVATLTTGNQTVTLNWTSVRGAQGYVTFENIGASGGNHCIPNSNNNCLGITTAATTLVYSGGSGCCFAVSPPTASADAAQGFNASGLIGAQQTLYNGLFKSVETPNRLTANRSRKVPDMDGTYAFDIAGTTSTITGTSLSNSCDTGTVAATGAVVGMPVIVSTTDGSDVGGAFNVRGAVTSSNTVTVYVCGTGTPPSKAYNVRVLQ